MAHVADVGNWSGVDVQQVALKRLRATADPARVAEKSHPQKAALFCRRCLQACAASLCSLPMQVAPKEPAAAY